jgi:hypothetical protein
MPLLLAHQILIGSAIALASLFGIRALGIFFRGGTAADLAMGLVSFVIAAALGLYFRSVRARWLAQQQQRRGGP